MLRIACQQGKNGCIEHERVTIRNKANHVQCHREAPAAWGYLPWQLCLFSQHIEQRLRWPRTRQAHDCELGRPTYQSHNKEQPPAECSVISG